MFFQWGWGTNFYGISAIRNYLRKNNTKAVAIASLNMILNSYYLVSCGKVESTKHSKDCGRGKLEDSLGCSIEG